MSVVSKGYKTLRPEHVEFEPWRLRVGSDGGDLLEPESIEDWSYYAVLEIRAAVQVDRSEAVAYLDLPDNAPIGVLIWWSSGTSLRGSTTPTVLLDGGTPVELFLDASKLRGQLTLSCQIVVLNEVPNPLSPLAPRRPGSVLWESSTTIRLEGVAPRMPVLAVPFSNWLARSSGAMWWLQLTPAEPDLYAPADGALWMWLNSENEVTASMLGNPDSPESRRTQMHMRMDLSRQLTMLAVRLEDLRMDEQYPAESLGAVLVHVVNLLGGDLPALQSTFRTVPELLEAEVQATFGGAGR